MRSRCLRILAPVRNPIVLHVVTSHPVLFHPTQNLPIVRWSSIETFRVVTTFLMKHAVRYPFRKVLSGDRIFSTISALPVAHL